MSSVRQRSTMEQRLDAELDQFRRDGIHKRLNHLDGPQGPVVRMEGRGDVIILSSNNYLGLAAEPAVVAAGKAALDRFGAGTASVRFICGTFTVHRELGPGMLESLYKRATCLELEAQGLSYEEEKIIPILYRGQLLCHHRLDIVVDERVILELKAVERLAPVHQAQAISYLRVSQLRIALLANFNVALLPQGLRRIVL